MSRIAFQSLSVITRMTAVAQGADSPMNWRQRYRLLLYFRNSLWILPTASIVVAMVSVSLLTGYEKSIGSITSVSAENARVIMSTVAGSTFTLVVLVSSAVLLAIQLASAQLTPRIISMVIGLRTRSRPSRSSSLLLRFPLPCSLALMSRLHSLPAISCQRFSP